MFIASSHTNVTVIPHYSWYKTIKKKKRLDNLFASKFILKFPTPPVQEKEDFPQRQQWTVSDSTLLGKEKLIITVSSFLLLNTSTAVIFGWVSADSLLSNHIPGKQRFKPIEQGCGLYILQCQCRNVLDCIPLLHQHKRKKTIKIEIKITSCLCSQHKQILPPGEIATVCRIS